MTGEDISQQEQNLDTFAHVCDITRDSLSGTVPWCTSRGVDVVSPGRCVYPSRFEIEPASEKCHGAASG